MLALADWLGRHPEGVLVLLMLGCGALAAGAWHGLRDAPGSRDQRRDRRSLVARVVAFMGLAVFAALAVGQQGDGRLVLFDQTLAQSLAGHASAALLRGLAILTTAGDRDVLIGLAAVVLAVLLWQRRWRDAGTWLAGTAGAGLLNMLLKASFARARPEFLHGYADAHGWSFPSGHATGAIAFYGMLAYLLLRGVRPAWHAAIVVATVLLIVAIGYSRVVLQVHYFSDVVAAYAVTLAWLVLCMVVRAWLEHRSSPR